MENIVFNRPHTEYAKERNLRITVLVAISAIYIFAITNGHVGISFAILTLGLFCGAFFFTKPNVVSHLSANDEGITTALNGIGLVTWDQIEEFSGIEGENKSFLIAELKKPNDWISGQSNLKRRVLKLNQDRYGSPIAIPQASLEAPIREVRDELNRILELRKAIK